jgi:ketosteroid isomerase-like protein
VATLSPSEATEAIEAIEAANEMLRAAVVESSIGNLAALETLWRDEALAKAQAFAQDFNQRYLRPLEVTFVYLAPPLAIKGDSPDTAYVISTEAWTYTGPKSAHDESLEFTYLLRREGEGWVIIDYTYGYAPISIPSDGEGRPTAAPIPGTITAPAVITPAGQ